MRAIITVIGKDAKGIIAEVSGYLAKTDINILDISQTIMQEYFTMVMLVEFKGDATDSNAVMTELEAIGKEIGVDIRMQNEEIFNSMHRI